MEYSKLEDTLKEKLVNHFEESKKTESDSIWKDYIQVREKAIEIADNINKKEPNLTDHSSKHIADVLDRAYSLIKYELDSLNFAEIYFLCVIILLHDVGNIHGRTDHQNKVAEIYNEIRKNDSKYSHERTIVLQAIATHSGESKYGDRDTIITLTETSNLYNQKVRLKELASILRFADELAEGPHRTSDFIVRNGKIKRDAKIFHVYAQITNHFIDRNRIVVNYNIDISLKEIKVNFENLLLFIYKRIMKLDEERRYCKYYSNLINSIKQTEVTITINEKGNILDLNIPCIILEDKFNISDDKSTQSAINYLINQYPQLKIENIVESVKKGKK